MYDRSEIEALLKLYKKQMSPQDIKSGQEYQEWDKAFVEYDLAARTALPALAQQCLSQMGEIERLRKEKEWVKVIVGQNLKVFKEYVATWESFGQNLEGGA